MKNIIQLISIFGIFLPYISARHDPFFRRDYTYDEDFDAHYKVHWDIQGLSWNTALQTCDDEGAILFYPKLHTEEWVLAKKLINVLTDVPNVTDIFIGWHDKYRVGEFISVDGYSTMSPLSLDVPDASLGSPDGDCVIMNFNTGAYSVHSCISKTPLPFLCKRIDDKPCPTIDREYKYIESSNKCYKVNKREKTWDAAMKTCFMERGILTVLENRDEADALKPILDGDSTYYIGIRKTSSTGDYYSVKGQKMDDLFQRSYRDYRSGIEIVDERKECGTIYVTNELRTRTEDCDQILPFICEMRSIHWH